MDGVWCTKTCRTCLGKRAGRFPAVQEKYNYSLVIHPEPQNPQIAEIYPTFT